ncbi:hypothetical protein M378DRAFT_161707 [Amanita muscaria Koide BX008]|uniref:Uncharacterized protein n=1 Tax=Amanita muscaria (strain Koide BX008) TaxID=946122 RepID=A0A0C2TFS1_AMAMK|nr:hypothetical protein M378DRAFT_161707 [Amanita muscaria Koide BX008]
MDCPVEILQPQDTLSHYSPHRRPRALAPRSVTIFGLKRAFSRHDCAGILCKL